MKPMNSLPADGRATRTKNTFRMEYSVKTAIKAEPAKIWAILTRASQYPQWNSTVKSVEGKIALGEKIKLISKVSPDRAFHLKVSEFLPEQKMIWKSGMAPMFKGVRTYTLTPKEGGTTEFTMTEVFYGIMLPMIAGSLPDFRDSFEQFAADLKREAERIKQEE